MSMHHVRSFRLGAKCLPSPPCVPQVEPIRIPAHSLPPGLQHLLLENVELRRRDSESLNSLLNLERRTTCRHFPEFGGMPLTRLVVSNCCVKAKGIASIAADCTQLTNLVFAVYKVGMVSWSP